jgi:4-amino-4-deoxy-L-arabinose transferase-like glycosyltransferase
MSAVPRHSDGVLSRRSTVWFILTAGLLLRIALLLVAASSPLRNDQKNYHDVALLLLRGVSFSPDWPPGLPYWLAAVHAFLGSSEIASRLAMLLLYVPFSLLLFHLASRSAGTKAGNIAVLLFALSPAYLFHSIEPLTQLPVTVCLLAMTAAMLWQLDRAAWWKLVLFGLASAAALLVRPASGIVVLFCTGYLGWKTKRVEAVLLPLVIVGLVTVTWLHKATEMSGHTPAINYNNSRNFFYGNNPYTPLYRTWWFGSHAAGEEGVPSAYTALITAIDARPVHERDSIFTAQANAHILARPDLFVLRSLNRVRCFFAYDTFTGSFLYKWYPLPRLAGLAAIGLDAVLYFVLVFAALLRAAGRKRGEEGVAPGIVAMVPLLYALPYFTSFSHPTYHFPVLPFLAVYAMTPVPQGAMALTDVHDAVRSLSRRGKMILAFAMLVFLAVQMEWTVMMIGRL